MQRIGFDDYRQRDLHQLEQTARHLRVVAALRRAGYSLVQRGAWGRHIQRTTH